MSEERTDTFGPYTGEDRADYDEGYYEERPRARILWGRVVILGVFLLVAFLLGRMTAPSGGVSRARLQEAIADREAALEQVDDLETQLAEAQEEQEPESEPSPPEEGGNGGGATEEEFKTYEVKAGDTLSTIAERFYGDAALDDFLAEYNGIEDPTALSVGLEIKIPDQPPDT